MAYTIIRSNGTTLTTIQDGTINTTSTALGLPGRNYAGYGQTLNTNFVRLTEHFANDVPPPNPIKGQLWYNTTAGTLNLCPGDGISSASAWLTLASTSSGGNTVLGNATITGNVHSGNVTADYAFNGLTITVRDANVSGNIIATTAEITTASISSLNTQTITTGSATTGGTLTGDWTVNGNNASGGNAFSIQTGNITFASNVYGVRTDRYMWANGQPFTPSGTYNDANVSSYLSDSVGGFAGNIFPSSVTTSSIKGGGTISGIWTLATGARLQATYADLAERYEADAEYEIGTVVALGGDKEVTAASELSEQVFGVVSNTYAYLMNEAAGSDATHPAIALVGRVKVKVTGPVAKHARLVSAGNGLARAAKEGELTAFNSIGRALEEKLSEDTGIIEAVVVVK